MTEAHAKALLRYDTLSNLRHVSMVANAATAQALIQALAQPDKLSDFAAISEAAQKSLDDAWKRWERLDQS